MHCGVGYVGIENFEWGVWGACERWVCVQDCGSQVLVLDFFFFRCISECSKSKAFLWYVGVVQSMSGVKKVKETMMIKRFELCRGLRAGKGKSLRSFVSQGWIIVCFQDRGWRKN